MDTGEDETNTSEALTEEEPDISIIPPKFDELEKGIKDTLGDTTDDTSHFLDL